MLTSLSRRSGIIKDLLCRQQCVAIPPARKTEGLLSALLPSHICSPFLKLVTHRITVFHEVANNGFLSTLSSRKSLSF